MTEKPGTAATATPTPLVSKRADHFASSYANTIGYEQSAWDLKLIFGQLDQTQNVVEQHLAVTIPWPQAKLAAFWLRVQVAFAEASIKTRIPIRPDLLPQELPAMKPEEENDPAVR